MQSFDSKDESIPLYVDLLSNGGFKAVLDLLNIFQWTGWDLLST